MIEVKARRRGGEFELKVDGHAGWSAAGGDIVCAAVSVLVFAFYGAMRDISSDGGAVFFRHVLEKGHAEITIVARRRYAGRAKAVFDCVIGALKMTEARYGGYVRVTEE